MECTQARQDMGRGTCVHACMGGIDACVASARKCRCASQVHEAQAGMHAQVDPGLYRSWCKLGRFHPLTRLFAESSSARHTDDTCTGSPSVARVHRSLSICEVPINQSTTNQMLCMRTVRVDYCKPASRVALMS